jgi:hypothetical protein
VSPVESERRWTSFHRQFYSLLMDEWLLWSLGRGECDERAEIFWQEHA